MLQTLGWQSERQHSRPADDDLQRTLREQSDVQGLPKLSPLTAIEFVKGFGDLKNLLPSAY